MASAFRDQLGSSFILISSVGSDDLPSYHHQLPLNTQSDKARYLSACMSAAWQSLRHRQNIVIYTRDIFVALTAALFGGQAIYEAHKEPKGQAAHLCTQFLASVLKIQFVFISKALANYYIKHYGITSTQSLIAHDGAFQNDYEALRQQNKYRLREELDLPLDKTLIVHTGSIYEGRGAHLFEHVARHAQHILFVQVGGESDNIAHWQAHYRQKGLNNIIFRPRQNADTVRRYQACADILFYMITKDTSTYWCCSPLKLFEYMASGTPILGSAIGSISEVLNERNAFTFDPEDSQSIHKAMSALLESPQEAQRRATIAAELIDQEYSWHIRAKRIINFARQSKAQT